MKQISKKKENNENQLKIASDFFICLFNLKFALLF